MDWFLHKTTKRFLLSPSHNPYVSSSPPPSSAESHGFSLNNTVSPSVFIIVVIFSVIFFLSGLAHLLIRLLWRPTNLSSTEMENLTALQGQLQQLFHLHDSGVDQSYIDTLPVFIYKEIIGVNSPFDCAVCLSEFEDEDELRLLPKCSHAFHVICIDTWLMSHSTCPLCRASLVPDFPSVLMALESESGSSSSSETVPDSLNSRSHDVVDDDDDFGLSCPNPIQTCGESWEKLVYIKLGKYRNGGGGGVEGSSSDNGGETRRCFSMGSYGYVMDEKSCLKVAINASSKKKPHHRPVMSELWLRSDVHHGLESFRNHDETQLGSDKNKYISSRNGRESFSASKIWLVGKKDECSAASMESTRRAFSFRYPLHRSAVAAVGLRADNGGSCGGRNGVFDNEIIRCKSWDFEANVPRRPLQWLMGRQNKVVHDASFSSNV